MECCFGVLLSSITPVESTESYSALRALRMTRKYPSDASATSPAPGMMPEEIVHITLRCTIEVTIHTNDKGPSEA